MDRYRMRAEESGVTLVELLVAIAITGIVAVGILSGLTTLSISSDRARKSSDAGSALYTAADVLQLPTVVYDTACPSTAYQAAIRAGMTALIVSGSVSRISPNDVSVTEVQYWDAATSTFTTTCIPSLATGDPRRLQRVTLRASLPDLRVDRSLQVVKRG